jgi:hypothetical protein
MSRREYLLAELRCASLRVRLQQSDIDAVGLALKGGLIEPEQALELLADCDCLQLISPERTMATKQRRKNRLPPFTPQPWRRRHGAPCLSARGCITSSYGAGCGTMTQTMTRSFDPALTRPRHSAPSLRAQ